MISSGCVPELPTFSWPCSPGLWLESGMESLSGAGLLLGQSFRPLSVTLSDPDSLNVASSQAHEAFLPE